ncbi:hypothetical protein BDB01DRAFT_187602 [Pilobolus umbonatus]|nr:hypothetical protein BDB01DRAFT_187602 [Pilobolus umbonatus]
MANDFPQSTFYGVDIIQPFSLSTDISTSHIPPNCVFEKADVLDGLAFESNTFDYIHQRMMYNAYPEDHIGFVFQEIKRVLKPNGWVELVDGDINPKNAGPKFTFLMEAVKKFLNSKLGAVFHAPLLQKTLIGIGLQDVSTDYGSVPICWGGIVGKQFYEDLLQVFNHIGTSIFHLLELGDTYDKSVYEDFLDSAFDECAEYQTFFNVRWAHGRLPEEVLE